MKTLSAKLRDASATSAVSFSNLEGKSDYYIYGRCDTERLLQVMTASRIRQFTVTHQTLLPFVGQWLDGRSAADIARQIGARYHHVNDPIASLAKEKVLDCLRSIVEN